MILLFFHFKFLNISADNKEQNQRLGFSGSFSSGRCCRFCRSDIDSIRTNVNSSGAERRNKENYDEDVAADNFSCTGIHGDSPFNRIPFFHVTDSSAPDVAHDLTHGTLHISFSKSLLELMRRKYFDLNYLNHRMASLDYGEAEKGNLPVSITMNRLKKASLRMSFSEMFFFAHHLTFIIGHRVPHDDEVWQHVLTTIKFFDLCYLPKYDRDSLNDLRAENEKLNQSMIDLFEQVLPHKAHIGTHYDELIDEIGPLRYVQTIR